MNNLSQTILQAKAFQSWRLVLMAVILLAAATTSGLYMGTVQAQSSRGALTGLTLTSDAPGTLTATWDAASPVPTDYRVDWAKSDEDYQSWKVDNGHVYPAADITTATITGLEHETDYKIRARARYYRGEHEGKSWGGPWATATITVAGEPAEAPEPAETPTPEPAEDEPAKEEPVKRPPKDDPARDDPAPEDTTPAAPSLINTAVSEGQVLLSWFNPEDDSITGYQISRGPDADSLVVIEDDTESNSTSYTDETPPAGQTHTYGVKARNSAGLSPAGTATAAVPEVLITARHGDGGSTLVSNLGQTAISIRAVVGTHLNFVNERAMSFTTGNNPYGYHLTNSQLYLRISAGSTDPIPGVSIRNDNEGVPGQTVLYTMTTTSAITPPYQLITFTTTDDFTLQPNTKYWLYVTINDGEAIAIRQTQSDDENVESNTDWEIGDSSYRAIDGGAWTEEHGENMQMSISGHAAPAFLVSNLDASPSGVLTLSVLQVRSTARTAQSFSAAHNADGSSAEFDFHAITVLLEGSGGQTASLAASDLLVTVHSDTSGEPGDLLYTLIPPAPLTVLGDGGPVTFTAPPSSTLSSGITYWLKLEAAAASTFFGGDFIFVQRAGDGSEVQGPTTDNRWTIGDSSLTSRQVLSWQTDNRVVKMSVLGAQPPPVLVSNLGQTDDGVTSVFDEVKGAQSFVAGPGLAGFGYRFEGVRVSASASAFRSTVFVPEVRVSLHSDASGLPGSRLHTLTLPDDFASTVGYEDYTLSAPPGTVLPGGARYWVVFEVTSHELVLRTTSSTEEDQTPPPVDGWLIDDGRYAYNTDIDEGELGWAIAARVIKLAVLGEPEWDTDEPDGEDFPGADFNAHETTGVVTVGTASSGLMTAGVDRNHGQTGDYWYLDTQPGRSYRVEVTFGGNAGISTGGSAGINFLDPDGVDYASSCCESDHNREDSATFVHFTHSHQSREWNRRYMVKVAAFDLYNEGTAVYNGPYLITMTDITGVQQMVHSFRGGTDYPATDLLEAGEDTADIAVSFRTGPHPGGYTLDRIKVLFHHIPAGDANQIVALHPDVSGSPGNTEECYLRTDRIAESAVAWKFKPPHTFLATFCASVTLTANTTYWIVFPMTNRNDEVVALATTPEVTDSYGSGWSVVGSGKRTTSTWVVQTDAQGRIGLWAEEN